MIAAALAIRRHPRWPLPLLHLLLQRVCEARWQAPAATATGTERRWSLRCRVVPSHHPPAALSTSGWAAADAGSYFARLQARGLRFAERAAFLTASLSNLGVRLVQLGRLDEALAPAQEAVDTYRRLADPDTGNPAAYLPDFATSLWAVGWICAAQGIQLSRGLASTAEAIAIFKLLAEQRPTAYQGKLEAAQATLSKLQDALPQT